MPKRKLVTPDTTEGDWLRKNVPVRTLTRWKKRKINKTLKDIGEHTTRQHESYEDASQREDQRAEPLMQAQESEDVTQREEQRAEAFTLAQESDEDASQREEQRGEPLTLAQDSEDVTQREEQRAEAFTLAQESDEDASQREEQRGEPLTLAQENNEDTSQRQEQRAESFTMVQDNVSQEVDVHSHGLTEGQSIISILSFALRHNTTGVLMEDLLKLLKLHSAGTSAVPTSKYFLEKPLAGIADKFERHHYCRVCTTYIGSSQSQEEILKCVSCSSSTTVETSLQEGHFFISIPLKDQLKDILENQGMHDLCFRADDSSRDSSRVKDICDGTLYQILKSNSEDDFLSLTFNCDGVPVFQSSKFSIWPILCCVNEIPPESRDKHVLVCALWFGSKKPDMLCFFKPFVEECVSLSQAGFEWQHPSDQSLRHIKVYTLCCVCDAVARPLLQNFKQFNGEYGCGVCLHPGIQTRKGKGNTRVYSCPDEKPSDRNHKTTVKIGQIAEREGKTILGIKGPSALSDLPMFDLINGMVPDYMHCVLLGVCRYMATLWMDSKSISEPWYIGAQTAVMDRHLLSIKPPGIVARVPRSLTERKFWKAHEWQHWLLYYSLPVLKGILPQKYHSHWALLIEGISILLESAINAELISHAHEALVYFVGGVQSLYGEEHMTFNVHSLLHLSKSVVHWGPLWAHSAFMFEDFNGYLLKQVKSSQAVPQQICKRVALTRAFPRLAKQFLTNAPAEVKDFCNEMRNGKQRVKFKKFTEVTALGPPNVSLLSLGDQAALHTVREVPTNTVVSYYKRIAVNGEVVHGHTYSKTKQRNNSVVLLKDGSIFRVSHFIDMGDQCLYAIGNYGNCTVQKLARGSHIKTKLSYMSTVHFPTGFHKAINATQVVRPCMYIHCPQSSSIVCRLLNTYYCK